MTPSQGQERGPPSMMPCCGCQEQSRSPSSSPFMACRTTASSSHVCLQCSSRFSLFKRHHRGWGRLRQPVQGFGGVKALIRLGLLVLLSCACLASAATYLEFPGTVDVVPLKNSTSASGHTTVQGHIKVDLKDYIQGGWTAKVVFSNPVKGVEVSMAVGLAGR